MTISQPSSSHSSNCAGALPFGLRPSSAASFGRFVHLALVRWRERRRAKADLARLAEAGDHLLRDIGLDPQLAHLDPAALLDQLVRDRPVVGDRPVGRDCPGGQT
jgi:uncharacterized protein YjiS (DUF1127 family)